MTATTTTIAHLKITLDDVKPEVLRRIEVPFNIRLDRLHLAVQAAMGWTNTHLYEIRAGDVGWGVPDPDWGDGPLDARKAHLNKVLEDVGTKTVKYIYDFGDGWDHTITIERLTDPVQGLTYPFLIEAKGRCPPEDVGGPPGYAEFLEAIRDPEHERHDECKTWIGEVFDPSVSPQQNARGRRDRGTHRMLAVRATEPMLELTPEVLDRDIAYVCYCNVRCWSMSESVISVDFGLPARRSL